MAAASEERDVDAPEFLQGRWVEGKGPATVLVDPTTNEPVAEVSSPGWISALRCTRAHDRWAGAAEQDVRERAAILDGLSAANPRHRET